MAANLLPIIAIAGAAFLLMKKKDDPRDIGDEGMQELPEPGPKPSHVSAGTLSPGTHLVEMGVTNKVDAGGPLMSYSVSKVNADLTREARAPSAPSSDVNWSVTASDDAISVQINDPVLIEIYIQYKKSDGTNGTKNWFLYA